MLAVAGDRLQGDDVVDLGAGAERHRTDPADRQRAADGLADVVGQHGRHQPSASVAGRTAFQRQPAPTVMQPSTIGPMSSNVVRSNTIAGVVLRLAEHRVGGAAADDADPVAAGEAEHSGDVLDRAGAQHGDRLAR